MEAYYECVQLYPQTSTVRAFPFSEVIERDLQCSIHFSLVVPISRIVWSVFSVFFPQFPDRQWNSNQEKTESERENYKSLRTD